MGVKRVKHFGYHYYRSNLPEAEKLYWLLFIALDLHRELAENDDDIRHVYEVRTWAEAGFLPRLPVETSAHMANFLPLVRRALCCLNHMYASDPTIHSPLGLLRALQHTCVYNKREDLVLPLINQYMRDW